MQTQLPTTSNNGTEARLIKFIYPDNCSDRLSVAIRAKRYLRNLRN